MSPPFVLAGFGRLSHVPSLGWWGLVSALEVCHIAPPFGSWDLVSALEVCRMVPSLRLVGFGEGPKGLSHVPSLRARRVS